MAIGPFQLYDPMIVQENFLVSRGFDVFTRAATSLHLVVGWSSRTHLSPALISEAELRCLCAPSKSSALLNQMLTSRCSQFYKRHSFTFSIILTAIQVAFHRFQCIPCSVPGNVSFFRFNVHPSVPHTHKSKASRSTSGIWFKDRKGKRS